VYGIAPPVKLLEVLVMLQLSILRGKEEREKRPESAVAQEMDVRLDPVISMDETDDENENKEEGIDKREKWQPDIFTRFYVVGKKEKIEDDELNVILDSV
jgi:hypothetical protein